MLKISQAEPINKEKKKKRKRNRYQVSVEMGRAFYKSVHNRRMGQRWRRSRNERQSQWSGG